MPDGLFMDAVTDKLALLLSEHGFRVTEASEHVVLLETLALCVQAVRDPRGEVDVNVFRRGKMHAGMWSFTGMVAGSCCSTGSHGVPMTGRECW